MATVSLDRGLAGFRPVLLCTLLALALPAGAFAQDRTGTVRGEIRDTAGRPVSGAFISVVGSRNHAVSDDSGRFELTGLPPGVAHLRITRIGMIRIDTTITLAPGESRPIQLVLRENDLRSEMAEMEARATRAAAEAAALGGIDSVARGLITTDTAASFTYERFGIALLRAAMPPTARDSSRVLSPLSAGQVLAVALAAARDSTAIAIRRVLELRGLDEEGLARRSRRFNERMRVRDDVTLTVANALWVDSGETLEPSFARVATTKYGAAVRVLELQGAGAAPAMNAWADSATRGLIPEIRDRPYGDSAVVALTNAVYFKGVWLEPFDTLRTGDREFTTARGDRLVVPTMERTDDWAYRRGAGYQALRLPYRAGLTAMYLVLPDTGVAAGDLLHSLVRVGWPLPDPRSEVRKVHLRLPKLHLKQATDLRPPFTALGLGIAFDSMRADFGGLVVQRRGRPPPCPPLSSGLHSDACTRFRISEASQHTFLEVDEQGTKAAAVTLLIFEPVITGVSSPVPFFVDRPFLLALRDEKTGTFLFMAYVAHPRQ